MLRTGSEHIERLQDGRAVYIGSERVDDVTTITVDKSILLLYT
jgi:aromatic ring hydroxylase